MGTLSSAIWLQLSSASAYAGFVPFVTGGLLALFRPWMISEDDVRQRIGLHRKASNEKVCIALHRVLSQVLNLPGPAALRGAPPNEPDIIGEYVAETFRIFAVIHECEVIHQRIRALYAWLLISCATGLGGVFVALLWDNARPYVTLVCVAIIVVQFICVLTIRSFERRLGECERTT